MVRLKADTTETGSSRHSQHRGRTADDETQREKRQRASRVDGIADSSAGEEGDGAGKHEDG